MAVVSFPDVGELMQLEAASMVGDGVWTILQATYPTANDIKRLFKTSLCTRLGPVIRSNSERTER